MRDGKQRVRQRLRIARPHAQASWFVLPPAEEYYYRRAHAEYRPLPALRADCQATRAAAVPRWRCCIRIRMRTCSSPSELDGQRGRTVFEAVHRRRDATVYWHLDGRYLGETHTFHQQSLDIDPGEHILTLVDDEGERVARRFQVIATREWPVTRVSCSMDSR